MKPLARFDFKKLTFFFCFPPPDLAGLEDGGGALSFFGAWDSRRKQQKEKTPQQVESVYQKLQKPDQNQNEEQIIRINKEERELTMRFDF